MSNNSILPIDGTTSGATTPNQSGHGSDGNEGVLRILQSSSITGVSLSDWVVSYPGRSLGGGLTLLLRCSSCTLRPQQTGPVTLPISLSLSLLSLFSLFSLSLCVCVHAFLNIHIRVFHLLDVLPYQGLGAQSARLFTHSRRKIVKLIAFPMLPVPCEMQGWDLNSGRPVHFLQQYPVHHKCLLQHCS